MGLLDDMAVSSRARCEAARAGESLDALRDRALATAPAPRLVLADFDLIAECKLRAPSSGQLAKVANPAGEAARRALMYAQAGAAAVSVLTEPDRFDGDLSHLAAAARASPVPVMRKDFLVDPYQVYEARLAGAGGVLLIAKMLDDQVLLDCLSAASECGLFVLLEAFDEEDLSRCPLAVDAWNGPDPLLVGINSRNLVSLEVEPERLIRLAPLLPNGVPTVAESGVERPEEARALVAAGYRLVLVGSALMRAEDPSRFAAQLLKEGRCS